MIKACVFDLDGTLLDTLGSIRYFVNETLEKYGIEKVSREECKRFLGLGARKFIENVFESRKVNDKELFDTVLSEYNDAYNSNPCYLSEPYSGIEELIDALLARNVKIAVVSNKPHFLTRPIVYHFFGDKVSECFGGRDNVPLKPAPDSTLEALEKLGVKSEEALYIGDSGSDMVTGKAASVAKVIGVLWGFRDEKELVSDGADIVVSHPLEILRVVDADNE